MSRITRISAGHAADAHGERDSVVLTVVDGRIAAVEAADSAGQVAIDVDARDCLLLPGFIDIHVHGGAGRGIMEGSAEAQSEVGRHLARHGVTGYLPTTITAPWDLQARAVGVAAAAMRSSENGVDGAAVLGVHLEGPYINPDKKGAQPLQFILPPDAGDLQRNLGDDLAALKVVTLAPEMPGALDLIRFLVQREVIVSLGHTDASYEQVCTAIDAGARHVTHTFNAMSRMEGRAPGVVGAAMTRGELNAELIWDNIHVHPASCQALIDAKGAGGVILISDGIPGAGMSDGYTFSLGDLAVTIQAGAARLPDGTLAGSLLTMDRAFQNASRYTLQARSAMTSRNAALALGLGSRKGLLAPGCDADLVLLGPDGAVRMTFVKGSCVYRAA